MRQPRQKLYIGFFDLINAFISILFGIGFEKGNYVSKFSKKIEDYWKRKKCFPLSSARICLYYYLKSLNLSKDSEVLLTPVQIPDYINIILELGLKPVFIEMDQQTQSIDLEDLKKKISTNSKVVLATYLTGILPNVDEIAEICKKNKIFLIEDISQSYGSHHKNIKAAQLA